jgi:putative transposase
MRKRHVQLGLERARRVVRGQHGGWRPGSGRRRGRKDVEHERRAKLSAAHPVNVTLRVVEGVNLRRDWLMPTIRDAIRDSEKPTFRVVDYNVMSNHMHMLNEADNALALSRGMIGLETRLARRLNKRLGRTGKLFVGRYHARALKTPIEVRNGLRYVLLNARHHAAEQGKKLAPRWIDTFSSGPWFDGWVHAPPPSTAPRPTSPPRTWLLRVGWRRHGLIAPDDVPGVTPSVRPKRTLPIRRVRSRPCRTAPTQLSLGVPALDVGSGNPPSKASHT